MAILRHRQTSDFTIIPNAIFKEAGLSLKGIGLLCLLLSLPDGWSFSIAGLKSICSMDGRDSISSAVVELERARYLIREQKRRSSGLIGGVEWIVSDAPLSPSPAPETGKPMPENPQSERPTPENPAESNTQQIKNLKKQEHSACATHSRFIPPSVEEVTAYCRERANDVDPQRFVEYYEAAGWKRGNTAIRDWRACGRAWEKRDTKQSAQRTTAPDYTAYQEESL